MIPLRDDQKTVAKRISDYFVVVLIIKKFMCELSVSHRALNSVMFEFGVVPHHTLAVLVGQSSNGLAPAVLPLFTSLFLHASLLHVAGNMLFLWIFGDNVEDYLGHFTYLVFYLVSGLAAGATHILLNQASIVPSVGASGAIAGVMGAYFILYPRARVLVWFPPIFLFHVPAWLMLGYWFLGNFLSGFATSIAA